MAIYSFNGFIPVIKQSSFIHPQASVIGNVLIGENVYVGPSAVIRGDWGQIIIEDGCNIQENCTVHMFPGTTVTLKKGAHIGHGAIIHGGTIGENCLIGMNSVIMDDVIMEAECIIGALSFVPAKMHLPKRSLAVGNPAKIIKEVSDEMITWKTQGTALYQALPADCHATMKACEPLREIEANRPSQEKMYETWNALNGKK
ncbi:MAG: transferase hexapeptide repeat family protein [Crocinitomicaceae bacterium]|nr:transferase hexapeptide repeat family protein [Crocinitomicaceae bacterium]